MCGAFADTCGHKEDSHVLPARRKVSSSLVLYPSVALREVYKIAEVVTFLCLFYLSQLIPNIVSPGLPVIPKLMCLFGRNLKFSSRCEVRFADRITTQEAGKAPSTLLLYIEGR